jgi:hypothetical protein
MKSALKLLCGLLLVSPSLAAAQDDGGREVREITKGTYAKANVGGALYVGPRSQYISPGSAMGLSVGSDFVNQERVSMAWEVQFSQGIHNGTNYEIQAEENCAAAGTCTQGDLRTYTFAALFEVSAYPARRFGVGGRAGAGMMLTPLLMDEQYYTETVIPRLGIDPSQDIHQSPHPVVMIGPTFEYYTKLAHFSAGLDVDAFYALSFDIGVSITGSLKYTF